MESIGCEVAFGARERVDDPPAAGRVLSPEYDEFTASQLQDCGCRYAREPLDAERGHNFCLEAETVGRAKEIGRIGGARLECKLDRKLVGVSRNPVECGDAAERAQARIELLGRGRRFTERLIHRSCGSPLGGVCAGPIPSAARAPPPDCRNQGLPSQALDSTAAPTPPVRIETRPAA